MSVNSLATFYKLGLATAEQANELASRTMDVCLAVARVAAGAGQIPRDDVYDVAADALVRAFDRIQTWDPARAGWRTYTSIIARSQVQNFRRWQHRQQNCLAAAMQIALENGVKITSEE